MIELNRREIVAALILACEFKFDCLKFYPDPEMDVFTVSGADRGIEVHIPLYTEFFTYNRPFVMRRKVYRELLSLLTSTDCDTISLSEESESFADTQATLSVVLADPDGWLHTRKFAVEIDDSHRVPDWRDSKSPLCYLKASALSSLQEVYGKEERPIFLEAPVSRLVAYQYDQDCHKSLVSELDAWHPREPLQFQLSHSVFDALSCVRFTRDVAFHFCDGRLALAGDTERDVYCILVWDY